MRRQKRNIESRSNILDGITETRVTEIADETKAINTSKHTETKAISTATQNGGIGISTAIKNKGKTKK